MKSTLSYLILAVTVLAQMIACTGTNAALLEDEMPTIEKYGQPVTPDLATVGVGFPYTGYYYGELTVNEETRIYKKYIPETALWNDYQVIITIPDGYNTEEFLAQSGWKRLADNNRFTLFIMEPINQQWGSVEDETAYIAAAYAKKALPNTSSATCQYIVGFDNGGQALQQLIMTDSLFVAAAVFVNASEIDASYLTSLHTQRYINNYSSDSSVYYSDVPVPVWIIDEDMDIKTRKVIKYWKEVNATVTEPESFEGGRIFYQSETDAAVNHFTPRGPVASVAVWKRNLDVYGPHFTRKLYKNFLSLTNRFGGSAWSNMILPRLNMKELGVQNYTLLDQGVLREYLVYVPENLRNSSEALPVVYSLPGGDGNQYMNLETTRWNEFADQYGYIIVSVAGESSLNKSNPLAFGGGPSTNSGLTGDPMQKWLSFNDTGSPTSTGYVDDVQFFEALIARVEADYNIDPTRRYLSGFSNGAGFGLEMVREIPEYFAAFGRTSGDLSSYSLTPTDNSNVDVPIYAIVGEHNKPPVDWSGNLSAGFSNAFTEYLVNKLGYSDADAATLIAHPVINSQMSDLGNGMYHRTWEWGEGQDENYFPIFRATTTSFRSHTFILADTAVQAEWFAHWSRINGTIFYEN